MTLKDQFRWLVGGYYGVREMDNYDLKVYVLKEIEEYIKDFIKENLIFDYSYKEEAFKLEDELSLKEKLQDSLLVLKRIKGPLELNLLIKERLKTLD